MRTDALMGLPLEVISETFSRTDLPLQHSERDAILLQLTTCRKLFAELQASTAMHSASNLLCTEHVGFVTKVCQELIHTTEFVPTLVSHVWLRVGTVLPL